MGTKNFVVLPVKILLKKPFLLISSFLKNNQVPITKIPRTSKIPKSSKSKINKKTEAKSIPTAIGKSKIASGVNLGKWKSFNLLFF